MDYSPPVSSVHGVFLERILEWVALPFSRGSSWPRNRTHFSCPFKVNTGVTSEVCLLCYGYSFLHRYFNAILLPIILIFSLQSVLKKGFIYLFIYFWLCWIFIALLGLSLVVASRGYSLLWCVGFFLWRLLLLWSMGSRCAGFSGCSLRAQ